MKNRKRIRIISVISCFLLLSAFYTVSASANSAQMRWKGVSSTGTIITDENCPITVEKELLTFDLEEFPKEYYETAKDYLAYRGNVTAEYTFSNPTDYAITAKLAFPLGKVPDYGYTYDLEKDEQVYNVDTDKYGILVDGRELDVTIRHTLSESYAPFDITIDLPKLIDGYVKDDFYTPDMPVHRQIYTFSGIDTKYNAATASFVWNGDETRTKILLEAQSGLMTLENGIRLDVWAENSKEVTLWYIGEVPDSPKWVLYEDGACENKIEGTVKLTDTGESESVPFQAFALQNYVETSDILPSDWYNAMVAFLKQHEQSYGVINFIENDYDLSSHLLRWYEYEITLEARKQIVNTVTAPIYPSIHSDYEPTVYNYTYLLSPAQTWSDFGTLDITIHTPYFITKSSLDNFTNTEDGYHLSLDGLPEGELTFTLCSSETPAEPKASWETAAGWISNLLLFGGVALLGIAGVTVLFQKHRN